MSEEAVQCQKYSKWKAAYIHNCLKNGETPQPGPLQSEEEDYLRDVAAGGNPSLPSATAGWNTNPIQPTPYQPPPSTPSPQPNQPANIASLPFNLPDPPKEPEPKHPGGFIPYNPSTSDLPSFQPTFELPGSLARTPEQIGKAQKYCKYVTSALNYDDIPTAIENLQKCLKLLQTGEDS